MAGLIALSGAQARRRRHRALQNGKPDVAERYARRWAGIFPDSFYIEMQRAGQPNDESQVRQRLRWRRSSACRWWRRIRCSS